MVPSRFVSHRGSAVRRIVLYSHDTVGLGHIRRNLLIAQQLAASPEPTSILLITGTRQANAFAVPPGVDCLCLPSVRKREDGGYDSRQLGISTSALIALRAKMILAAVEEFDPDVLIVDKVPRGVLRELDPTLRRLRSAGRTRCVLGLRDVLDDPESVRFEWCAEANEAAIGDFYDAVWVYGDRNVYDVVDECGFSGAVVDKLHFVGYLDPRQRWHARFADGDDASWFESRPRKRAVCLVGGGEDGARLACAFAKSEFPRDMEGVVLSGPFMPPEVHRSLLRTASENPRLHVLRFTDEPDHLVRCADRVIAMAGYNTTCEVLCHRKPTLVVPRVKPRSEQWIRATRFHAFGLLDLLHPDQLTSGRLTEWLGRDDLCAPDPRVIDFGGLPRLTCLLDSLCSGSPDARSPRRPSRNSRAPSPERRAAAVWSCDEDSVPLH
jgi:predicted glycosyltransferase